MLATILKALVTAAFIIAVAEVAKRSTLLAALAIGLPMATMLTVGLTYFDTRNPELATRLATTTFLLVWPGLFFFLLLPFGQRSGLTFWPSFSIAIGVTVVAYTVWIVLLRRLGVQL